MFRILLALLLIQGCTSKEIKKPFFFHGLSLNLPKDFSPYSSSKNGNDDTVFSFSLQYAFSCNYTYNEDCGFDECDLNQIVSAKRNATTTSLNGEIQKMLTKDKQVIYYYASIQNQSLITIHGFLLGKNRELFLIKTVSNTMTMSYLYKKTLDIWYGITKS